MELANHAAQRVPARLRSLLPYPGGDSSLEASLIGQAIGRAVKKLKNTRDARERAWGYEHPCPFLRDGECSIYEHRPLPCRVHVNMDEDALLCELLPGQTVPVPLANSTYFQAVYVKLAVASGSTMADIRDFFPQGSCRDCDAGKRLEKLWPCEDVPRFSLIAEELMEASLGSVGMLKSLLVKAAFLQMERTGEKWHTAILAKAAKSRKLLETIEMEIVVGERVIAGHTYGESMFESEEVLKRLAQKMEAVSA